MGVYVHVEHTCCLPQISHFFTVLCLQAGGNFYYSCLPSSPKLVYRMGTTLWTKPTGPDAQRELKELRPVFSHKLNTAWKDLGPKVCHLLDSVGVWRTTIDVVRFIKVGERGRRPRRALHWCRSRDTLR